MTYVLIDKMKVTGCTKNVTTSNFNIYIYIYIYIIFFVNIENQYALIYQSTPRIAKPVLPGNRPIHTSTGANGPDQYINMLHVRKHTSIRIKFNFPYINLQNWVLTYIDLISVSQTLRNKSFR